MLFRSVHDAAKAGIGTVFQEFSLVPTLPVFENLYLGRELRTGSASANGRETVVGTVLMLIGQNSRVVAQDASTKLDQVAKSLPPGIEVKVVLDRIATMRWMQIAIKPAKPFAFGVLAAGAAYVPVDADDPEERARLVDESFGAQAFEAIRLIEQRTGTSE